LGVPIYVPPARRDQLASSSSLGIHCLPVSIRSSSRGLQLTYRCHRIRMPGPEHPPTGIDNLLQQVAGGYVAALGGVERDRKVEPGRNRVRVFAA
jgi:hypothetical protein